MRKFTFVVMFLFGFMTLIPISSYAANPVTVYVNGQMVVADELPYINNGRVMLPFRVIGEQLGAQVVWDEPSQRVSFIKDGNQVDAYIGSLQYAHNGVFQWTDVAPEIRGSRTFVPVRFLSEALQVPVEWNDIRRCAYIGTMPEKTLDPGKPMVALTFDDGPSAGKTERIVQALAQTDARATFFMVGTNIPAQPQTVWQVASRGNEIGNHSYNHPDFTKVPFARVQAELNDTDQAIASITGEPPTLIRPTYGSVNAILQNSVNRPLILWNIDPEDWRTRNTRATVDHVMAHVTDGSIVLMHDIHEPTVQATLELIPRLEARGYQLVTVSEMLAAKGVATGPGMVVTNA